MWMDEADGKTFFKLCSFSSKSGEADLNVDNAGGCISGCKRGGSIFERFWKPSAAAALPYLGCFW